MGLTFDTSEVDRALAKLLAQDTTPIVAAGADVVAEHWREGAPVNSGNLRDGIYGQTVSPTEGEAGAVAPYAPDTEFRSSKPGWAAASTAAATEPAIEAMGEAAADLIAETLKAEGKGKPKG